MLDDPSDQAVASRFFGGQPEVARGVLLDPLEGLSGLLRELAVQPVAHLENLTCLDLDIAGGPAGAACRLVQQEARVREAVAVFARHRDVDQGRDRKTRLNSSHSQISYAVFCLKKKKKQHRVYHLDHDAESTRTRWQA